MVATQAVAKPVPISPGPSSSVQISRERTSKALSKMEEWKRACPASVSQPRSLRAWWHLSTHSKTKQCLKLARVEASMSPIFKLAMLKPGNSISMGRADVHRATLLPAISQVLHHGIKD